MPAHILVVEDDDETREAVVGSLEDLGYEVLACSEARAAKLALEQKEFDVLVTVFNDANAAAEAVLPEPSELSYLQFSVFS